MPRLRFYVDLTRLGLKISQKSFLDLGVPISDLVKVSPLQSALFGRLSVSFVATLTREAYNLCALAPPTHKLKGVWQLHLELVQWA